MEKKTHSSQKLKINQKQELNNIQKSKTTKLSNEAHHQNPYIPPRVELNKKSQQSQNKLTKKDDTQIKSQQKQVKTNCESENNEKQKFNQNYQHEEKKSQENNHQQQEDDFNDQKITSTDPNTLLNLPVNFKSLPLQERYSILSKKHGKDKRILQKRFDVIYKHYRKQMYIPNQSFQINHELLMDLKIFLKYFKDFDLAAKFKTNESLKHFKKIALNGLWLDQKNFISVHYRLIELLDVNLLLEKFDSSDPEKVKLMKRQTLKSIKDLQQNLIKIKKLSDMISQNKIKQVLKKRSNDNIVKKIIQSHSGLSQQDVILKLNERIYQKKLRKNLLQKQKIKAYDPNKKKIIVENVKKSRVPQFLHQPSLYRQIQLPEFRSRQMRNSSVYSSLEILNIEKQRTKIRDLLKQKDNEAYLQQFFRKQKKIPNLMRSNSVSIMSNLKTKNQTESQSLRSSILSNRLPKINTFQRNFSLPRMRFT